MKAMGQQKAQDAIQSPSVSGWNPTALTVAIPVTIHDISPDMISPKMAWAKRAGIISDILENGSPDMCAIRAANSSPMTGVNVASMPGSLPFEWLKACTRH